MCTEHMNDLVFEEHQNDEIKGNATKCATKCTIKWDIDLNRAKHIFNDLGINFIKRDNRFAFNNRNDKRIQSKHMLNNAPRNEPNQFNHNTMIDDLSDEILLHIFKFIPRKTLMNRCSRVSKRWYRLSRDSSLWKCIDLSKKQLSFEQLSKILSNGVTALRMKLTILYGNEMAFNALTRIEYLDLSMATISIDVINAILSANDVSLRKLSIEGLDVNQMTMDVISDKHKSLEVLNMTMCNFIGNDITFKSQLPEPLTELSIGWTHHFSASTVIPFLPHSLKRLNVSGHRFIVDDDIAVLVNKCPQLIELDLCDCITITCISIMRIQKNLPNLESLHISRCYGIDDFSEIPMMGNLKVLSILGISYVSSNLFANITLNSCVISTIARPTVGESRSTIWGVILDP